MPKQRITKEMVVNAAFEIARNDGMEQVMVKTIAEKIGCSVQPIYSYCKNMEGLRQDVTQKVSSFIVFINMFKHILIKTIFSEAPGELISN